MNKEDGLRLTQALPYVQEYMQQLGVDISTTDNVEIQKVFDEIDEDGNGTIERHEMYNHLKRSKRVSNLSNKAEEPAETKEKPAKEKKMSKKDMILWKKV